MLHGTGLPEKGKWDASCSNEIKNMFNRLNKKFISKGIPCIIGEYGTHGSKSVSKTSSASEIQAAADQAADIVKQAKSLRRSDLLLDEHLQRKRQKCATVDLAYRGRSYEKGL